MKFRILPKVKSFSDAHGNEYYPGDVVDLPVSYLGESWLEPVDKVDVKKPESKTEFVAEKEAAVPFETPKTQRKVKKKVKVLIGVPCLNDKDRYAGYRDLILDAAELSIGNVEHSVYVTPNSTAIEIYGIIECDNDIIKYFLSKDFTHLWMVELDTVVPKDAFSKLFGLDVDIALGFYPSHRDFNRLIAGWIGEDGKVYYLPRFALKGQVLRGWVFAGTGCMLVKRRVFEVGGIRFKYNPDVGGPDVTFMFESLRRGFTAALHGDVECGHLPEWPLKEG